MDNPTIRKTYLIKDIMSLITDGHSAQNPPFSVMTIHMKDPSLQKATAEHRKTLLSVILLLYPSAIIFCQDLPKGFRREVLKDASFEFVCNKEETTAVIWATKQFDSNSRRKNGVPKKNPENKRERKSIVKLKSTQEPAISILAVSYHGPYSGKTHHDRCDRLDELLKDVHKKKNDRGIHSLIVGGDFNLDTRKYKTNEKSAEKLKKLGVIVGEYELTARANMKVDSSTSYIPYKDNFFWSDEITVEKITALQDPKYDEEFDHDPVEAQLLFKPHKPDKGHAESENSANSVGSGQSKDGHESSTKERLDSETSPTR